MKDYDFNKIRKKENFLWISLTIVYIFLCIGVICAINLQEMSTFEMIYFMLPGAAILIMGIVLFYFFRNQIVDIKVYKDKLVFIKASGKRVSVEKQKDIGVVKTENGYKFVIEGIGKLSSYKYRPADLLLTHSKYVDKLVERLAGEGVFRIRR